MHRFPVGAMFPKPEPPCHYCEERHFKCFSSCDKYAEYKKAIADEKEKYISKYRPQQALDDYVAKQKIKNIEKRRKRS